MADRGFSPVERGSGRFDGGPRPPKESFPWLFATSAARPRKASLHSFGGVVRGGVVCKQMLTETEVEQLSGEKRGKRRRLDVWNKRPIRRRHA